MNYTDTNKEPLTATWITTKIRTKFSFGMINYQSEKKANFLLVWWCYLLGIKVEKIGEE
jgi:hypothetical protein